MSVYSEDNLVQKTTADYLKDNLGWDESVYAMEETFGPAGTLGRANDSEVVLTRYLVAALRKFNPGFADEVYAAGAKKVAETSVAMSLDSINREKRKLMLEGVEVPYVAADGTHKKTTLAIFDFKEPVNNHFLCVREFWMRGTLNRRRRADVVGFVNGIPLVFMELKNVHRDIELAYRDNFCDYRKVVPALFHFNAFVILANGIEAKIGAHSSKFKFFHSWKRLSEDDVGAVDNETMLKGVCSKENLIDILENFIVYDESTGGVVKIIARNHQFLGVNRAVESVRRGKELAGKLGVFWHTQGSGKSYSMVFFARKVRRKLGGNYTFVVLTDRDELDTQIYRTFAGCGLADNDKDQCRATSGDNLRDLLRDRKSYVFSLIQKFNKEVSPEHPYSSRDDIIVISDEAHRTQYGLLALNMRNALPNASYIGFTGTPLFSGDELTRRVFGDYVSKYDFQRAVEDGATVPLYYDARGEKLKIATTDINERVADVLSQIEVSDDVDVREKLEKELKRDYHVITAEKRLDQVARDFVRHYSTSWETGKAMLVCIDKITCVRMHDLIGKYWAERIVELEAELASTDDEQEEQFLRRQIAWMRGTIKAVVVSEEQNEDEKFAKWGLDILTHRKLMKEGLEIPESFRDRLEYLGKSRMTLDEAFKEDEHPFRIAIVCAMWLTGFDVPSLSALYLDKPLKAHTLMQAIARANRVNEGKNNGLIVDYCGILKNLRKALATFATSGVPESGQDPIRPPEELLADLAAAIGLIEDWLAARHAPLSAIIETEGFARNAAILASVEAVNENDESRKRFEVMCTSVLSKFKACINFAGLNEYRSRYDAIIAILRCVRKGTAAKDVSGILRALQKVVDAAIEPRLGNGDLAEERAPYDISSIDFDRLKQEFERLPQKNTAVQDVRRVVEARLQMMLARNPLRTNFQQHFEKIIADYNSEKDRQTIEQTFEALLKFVEQLDEEEARAVSEGLDEESLAIFDLIRKPKLKPQEIARVKDVAKELLAKLKAEKLKVDHWQEKERARDGVKQDIFDFLFADDTGLPAVYSETEIREITTLVYQHVFAVYPKVPSPYFQGMAEAC